MTHPGVTVATVLRDLAEARGIDLELVAGSGGVDRRITNPHPQKTGLALSGAVVDIVRARIGNTVPLAPLDASIWLLGLALMIAIGLIVGALPALRGMRLRIVDALSGR